MQRLLFEAEVSYSFPAMKRRVRVRTVELIETAPDGRLRVRPRSNTAEGLAFPGYYLTPGRDVFRTEGEAREAAKILRKQGGTK